VAVEDGAVGQAHRDRVADAVELDDPRARSEGVVRETGLDRRDPRSSRASARRPRRSPRYRRSARRGVGRHCLPPAARGSAASDLAVEQERRRDSCATIASCEPGEQLARPIASMCPTASRINTRAAQRRAGTSLSVVDGEVRSLPRTGIGGASRRRLRSVGLRSRPTASREREDAREIARRAPRRTQPTRSHWPGPVGESRSRPARQELGEADLAGCSARGNVTHGRGPRPRHLGPPIRRRRPRRACSAACSISELGLEPAIRFVRR
jgi:hypothetical protein